LQEDPIGFEANDLNFYRYTWNNPLNWTDPSGKATAVSEGFLNKKIAKPLAVGSAGAVGQFLTRAGTANFLKSQAKKNVLRIIGAGVNCRLFTVAAAISVGSSTGLGVTVDGGNCDVNIGDQPQDEPPEPANDNDPNPPATPIDGSGNPPNPKWPTDYNPPDPDSWIPEVGHPDPVRPPAPEEPWWVKLIKLGGNPDGI